MPGYQEHAQTVTIVESKTTTIDVSLEKYIVHHNIGELVTINGVQGIVFQNSPVVKIVSVKETTANWSTDYETTNARDKDNGKANMDKIKYISGWQTKYPTFKWCADYGDGWYLPSLNELKAIYAHKYEINKVLLANNLQILGSNNCWLWCSTETNTNHAYSINFSNGNSLNKNGNYIVRAVYVIE